MLGCLESDPQVTRADGEEGTLNGVDPDAVTYRSLAALLRDLGALGPRPA